MVLFHSPLPAQVNNSPCIVETREYPGKDRAMWRGLYAARDGKVYTGLCGEGGSAHFYQYDPGTDSHRCIADIAEFLGERGKGIRTSGKIHCRPVEDRQGNIYFISMNDGAGPRSIDYTSWQGGHWIRYDPSRDKLEDLGLVDRGVGCYPLAIDEDRNHLFGITFTGYLFRLDIAKRVSTNLGRVDNWDICRDIVCDDQGNVYGCFPVSRVWKYDAEKGKVIDLAVEIPYDPTIFPTQLNNPMIDRSTIWRAVEWDPVGKAVYGITCGSGSILFKYEPHQGPEGRVSALGRLCDGKFLEKDNYKAIPYSPLAFALDSRNRKVYFVPSAREYAIGSYEETFGSSEDHHLIMYDLKENRRVDLGVLRTADGRRVFGCEAASCGPDGTVYLCGQARVKDPANATWFIGDIPLALHLIIYRPGS
ncbi:MAG: hypothetical protein JXQ83_01915 [Candidatus Glassbacteria bacterium]|nr:hypothetical protein [Candidatus Glassbacteria bacterium]